MNIFFVCFEPWSREQSWTQQVIHKITHWATMGPEVFWSCVSWIYIHLLWFQNLNLKKRQLKKLGSIMALYLMVNRSNFCFVFLAIGTTASENRWLFKVNLEFRISGVTWKMKYQFVLETGNWKPGFWNPGLKTLILGCWAKKQ